MRFHPEIRIFLLLSSPAFALLFTPSFIGLLFAMVCIISSLVYISQARNGNGGKIGYVSIVMRSIFIMLSRGYFSGIILAAANSGEIAVLLIAASIAFAECGLILGRNYDVVNQYRVKFEMSGFEAEELETELGIFVKHVQGRMLRVLFFSVGILALVMFTPIVRLSPVIGIAVVGFILVALLRLFTMERVGSKQE